MKVKKNFRRRKKSDDNLKRPDLNSGNNDGISKRQNIIDSNNDNENAVPLQHSMLI